MKRLFVWFRCWGIVENWLIQEASDSVSVAFQYSFCSRDGIPGELHPRTIPINMNDSDAEQAAPIWKAVKY